MALDFYHLPSSCPCQSVRLLAKVLDLELNLIEMHLRTGDHLKPDFIKINPQHTFPTLNDNGFVLWESRAILAYLVDQYAKDDSLFPKDPKKRVIVNQRLFFDIGTLYPKYINYYRPILYTRAKPDPAHIEAFKEPLEFLDKFLEGEEWVAGSNLTIADISLLTTVSIMKDVGYNISQHSNVSRWFSKTKQTIPDYDEIVTAGNAIMVKVIDTIAGK